MAKKQIRDYSISTSANTISIKGNIAPETMLLITDVGTGTIVYNFASPTLGYASYSFSEDTEYTTFVMKSSLTTLGVTNSSKLQIFIDKANVDIDMNEALLDPVNKIRVSTPENLIDTDFEYGLQPSKWETLELENNIPSFYASTADAFLYGIINLTSTAGSDLITVTLTEPHRLSQGTPLDIRGLSSQTAEGKYLINRIVDELTFTYKAQEVQSFTGIISGPYTVILPGQFYNGSQIEYSEMTSDGAPLSQITLTTPYENGFKEGSAFYLTNTIGAKFLSLTETTTVNAPDNRPYVDPVNSFNISLTTEPTLTETKDYTGAYAKKINASDVDVANSRIIWDNHGLKNGDVLLYVPPSGNVQIGGLQRMQFYYVNNATTNNFQLSYLPGDSFIPFTSAGEYTYGRGQFILSYEIAAEVAPDQSPVLKYKTTAGQNNSTVIGSGWDRMSNNSKVSSTNTDRLMVVWTVNPQDDFYINVFFTNSERVKLVNNISFIDIIGELNQTPNNANFVENGDSNLFNYKFVDAKNWQFDSPDSFDWKISAAGQVPTNYFGQEFSVLHPNPRTGFIVPLKKDPEANTLYSLDSNLLDDSVITMSNLTGPLVQYSSGTDWAADPDTDISAGGDIVYVKPNPTSPMYTAIPTLSAGAIITVVHAGGTSFGEVWHNSWQDGVDVGGGYIKWGIPITSWGATSVPTSPITSISFKKSDGNSLISLKTININDFISNDQVSTTGTKIESVSKDRFRLKDANATRLNLYAVTGQYSADALQNNTTSNSFYIENHGLVQGDSIKITADGTGVLPATTAGLVDYDQDKHLTAAWNQVNAAIRNFKLENSAVGITDLVLDGFDDTNFIYYGSPNGMTDGSFNNLSFNVNANGISANTSNRTAWATELIADPFIGQNSSIPHKIIATRVSRNRVVPYVLHIMSAAKYFNSDINTSMSFQPYSYDSTNQGQQDYQHALIGNGWYAASSIVWSQVPNRRGHILISLRLYNNNWGLDGSYVYTPSEKAIFNQNVYPGSNLYGNNTISGSGADYIQLGLILATNVNGQANLANAEQLRDAIITQIQNAFVYPNFTSQPIAKATVIDNNRFSLVSGSGVPFDISDSGTSTLKFELIDQAFGAVDGAYSVSEIVNDTTFKIDLPFNAPEKILSINTYDNIIAEDNLFYIPSHYLASGSPITYNKGATSNTNIQNLTSGSTYYASVVDDNYFGLCTTRENAIAGSPLIDINIIGTAPVPAVEFTVSMNTVIWYPDYYQFSRNLRFDFYGTYPGSQDLKDIILDLIVGDTLVLDGEVVTVTATSLDLSGDGNILGINVNANPPGNNDYYVKKVITTPAIPSTGTEFQSLLSNTVNGNTIGPGRISVNNGSFDIIGDELTLFKRYYRPGDTMIIKDNNSNPGKLYYHVIESITDDSRLRLTTAPLFTAASTTYLVSTSLIVKTDGAYQHRAFDGGVEITAGKGADSQVIRQTRKYFRYQSGKGIQTSLAINFNPPTLVETLQSSGTTATATTKYPHGFSVGSSIRILGSDDNAYNGNKTVVSVPDEFTFTYQTTGTPSTQTPDGIITVTIQSWNNSSIRAGMFDFQNGFFFEYDGTVLYAVRRSSAQQLAGVATVFNKSNIINGTNTNFNSLNIGDKIVVRGMTYKVVKVKSKTQIAVQPAYKGISAEGVIITKTVDTKVAQSDWSLDKCDGLGVSGFNLDLTKIQMAYMDYSWYGAGKIRFGFKDRTGRVIYAHEFIHNNRITEAYMRSGNLPARYEIENTGVATYVPTLFHWGTSVIMDGRFDNDKAYLFTALSNTVSLTNGQSIIANMLTNTRLVSEYDYNIRTNKWYVELLFSYEDAYKFTVGTALYSSPSTNPPPNDFIGPRVEFSGELVETAYYSGQFIDNMYTPVYVVRVLASVGINAPVAGQYPNLPKPTAPDTIGIGAPPSASGSSASIRSILPLISIRLAPSVDNNLTGELGAREIINRMQLQLSDLGLTLTHDCEVYLILNGSLSNVNFVDVTEPSLSNLIKHNVDESIIGGTTILTLRASGGGTSSSQVFNPQTGQTTTVSKRLSNTTTVDLKQITDLGNSILGGDDVFPNGPDLLTVAVKVINVAEVSANSPFSASARITWTESQA